MKTQLLICVPVVLAPHWHLLPSNNYSTWEKARCPDCNEEVWLGVRGKQQVAEGKAVMTCAVCAVEKYKVGPGAKIQALTTRDN